MTMDQATRPLDPLCEVQIPGAFARLQRAMTEYVEDLNRRFHAGLAVRGTPATFEVHVLEIAEALVTLSLVDSKVIRYSRFIKRGNERQEGIIDVRLCPDGAPMLMFPDFPRPSVQVSYQDASKRLLDSSF